MYQSVIVRYMGLKNVINNTFYEFNKVNQISKNYTIRVNIFLPKIFKNFLKNKQ
jgi:ERCC4-type nuclease